MGPRVELLAGVRVPLESSRAVQACNAYLRLGPGRSLSALARQYAEVARNVPRTASHSSLKKWSVRFEWQKRAAAYDAALEAQKNEIRRQEMESELALDFERVRALKKLAGFLAGEIEKEEDGRRTSVWLPDVKQIGSGEDAERVDIVRFNSDLIDQYRGTLDDLAKETGGRRPKAEAALLGLIDYSKLSNEQLERIASGEDPVKVLISGSRSTGDSERQPGAPPA